MLQLRDIDREAAEILLDIVINKKMHITYKDLAAKLSERLGRYVHPHYTLQIPLGNVSTICFNLGLPLLSCRVIYSNSNGSLDIMKIIGPGFYPFACELRPEYKLMSPEAAWKNEIGLTRNCSNWDRLRQYIDGVEIEVILSDKNTPYASTNTEPLSKEMLPIPELKNNIHDAVFPDEVNTSTRIKEGASKTVNVNIHERNPFARQKCIEFHGTACSICGINLGDIYGEEFSGKIHVHHLKPIKEYACEHDIDPTQDLRPVCPNCHMIIHCRQEEPYSIDEVRAFIRKKSKSDITRNWIG
jgi:hypothetical protein